MIKKVAVELDLDSGLYENIERAAKLIGMSTEQIIVHQTLIQLKSLFGDLSVILDMYPDDFFPKNTALHQNT